MELACLLRLLLAHFLGDFLFQPSKWVEAKVKRGPRAPEMYYHALMVGLLSAIFLWDWQRWYIPVIIMFSHLLIDIWKSRQANRVSYFIIDQLLHVAVIITLWQLFWFDGLRLSEYWIELLNSPDLWIIMLTYYLGTIPLGIAIGMVTRKWQAEAGMESSGLPGAGVWIGCFERVLVISFILLGQYTALGFLMAAKSILRFSDAEQRAQKKTEYILVGTLISFASAAILAVGASLLLEKY